MLDPDAPWTAQMRAKKASALCFGALGGVVGLLTPAGELRSVPPGSAPTHEVRLFVGGGAPGALQVDPLPASIVGGILVAAIALALIAGALLRRDAQRDEAPRPWPFLLLGASFALNVLLVALSDPLLQPTGTIPRDGPHYVFVGGLLQSVGALLCAFTFAALILARPRGWTWGERA